MACLKSFTRQAGDVPPGNAFRMQQPRLWRHAARFQSEQKGPNCPQPANPCQRSRSARSVWRASGYCPRGGAGLFQAAAMCEPSKGMDLSETDNCSADAAAWKARAPGLGVSIPGPFQTASQDLRKAAVARLREVALVNEVRAAERLLQYFTQKLGAFLLGHSGQRLVVGPHHRFQVAVAHEEYPAVGFVLRQRLIVEKLRHENRLDALPPAQCHDVARVSLELAQRPLVYPVGEGIRRAFDGRYDEVGVHSREERMKQNALD